MIAIKILLAGQAPGLGDIDKILMTTDILSLTTGPVIFGIGLFHNPVFYN